MTRKQPKTTKFTLNLMLINNAWLPPRHRTSLSRFMCHFRNIYWGFFKECWHKQARTNARAKSCKTTWGKTCNVDTCWFRRHRDCLCRFQLLFISKTAIEWDKLNVLISVQLVCFKFTLHHYWSSYIVESREDVRCVCLQSDQTCRDTLHAL